MRRFQIVDFLKGYSIFTIMIFHYSLYLSLSDPLGTMMYFGGTGVHLFVLVSGFGLYYSYLNRPITYIRFIRKRFLKVYFPYILVILFSAVISISIPVYDNSLYALGGHLFLYKMFDESIIGSYGYPLWFMSMIFQFYLIFYVILWIKSKLNDFTFLILGILLSISWSVLVLWIDKENQRIWNSFFLQYIWEFLLGMVLAKSVFTNQRIIGKEMKQWLILLIAIINCTIYAFLAIKGGSVGKLFNDFFALAGYSLLAIWIYNLNLKYLNQFFLYIGKVSLPIYLLHMLILLTISEIFIEMNAVYTVILALCCIIPISALYQKAIDIFFKQLRI